MISGRWLDISSSRLDWPAIVLLPARGCVVLIFTPALKTISKAVSITVLYTLLYVFCADCVIAAGDSKSLHPQDALIAKILREAAGNMSSSDRITSISSHFLGTPYLANSLIGSPAETEQLVLRLDGFDCFTFLDTVEALRRSNTAGDFPEQMVQVRYRDGKVSYENRRHFFSDWVSDHGPLIKDVTAIVSQGRAIYVDKTLNARASGAFWVPGIDVVPRTIAYIPASEVDETLLVALEPGDYVGVFSQRPGLDVSHTGLIVKTGATVMLRHASSREGVRRVIDEELDAYMHGKTGLIVYRVAQ